MKYLFYDLYTSLINKPKFWLNSNFSKYKFSDKDKSIINQFSLPGFEKGISKVVEKVFRCKIDGSVNINSKDVRESDELELKVYSMEKKIKFSHINTTTFLETIEFVYNSMGLDRILCYRLTVDQAIASLPSDGNSGFPIYKKKGDIDAISKVKFDFNKFKNFSDFKSKINFIFSNPTVIFHRFSPKLKDLDGLKVSTFKIRQIWGVPFLIVLLEKMYFDKFIYQFNKSMTNFYTSGRTRVEISDLISDLRNKSKLEDRVIMCGDIKGCDKSVPSCFFQMLAFMFKKSVKHDSHECFIIDIILKYLCFTPYLNEKGEVKHTHGSTVSGSLITSLFTTFVVFTSLSYIYKSKYGRFPEKGELLVQGDDFVMIINDMKEAESIKLMLKNFNLRLNLSATSFVTYNDNIDYLGFFWNINNEPDQTDNWIIAKTVFPERYVDLAGPDRSITRYLSLIFQLSRYTTLFKLFFNFDKYMKRKFQIGGDNIMYILDSKGKVHINKIPINKYLSLGWKLF